MIYEKTFIIRIKIMRKRLPVIMVVTPFLFFSRFRIHAEFI